MSDETTGVGCPLRLCAAALSGTVTAFSSDDLVWIPEHYELHWSLDPSSVDGTFLGRARCTFRRRSGPSPTTTTTRPGELPRTGGGGGVSPYVLVLHALDLRICGDDPSHGDRPGTATTVQLRRHDTNETRDAYWCTTSAPEAATHAEKSDAVEACTPATDATNVIVPLPPSWWYPSLPERVDICVDYEARYQTMLCGLYRCRLDDNTNDREDGAEATANTGAQCMIVSQFQPTHARRAFPCVDWPSCKATFQLTVSVPRGLQVLSNTSTVVAAAAAADPYIPGAEFGPVAASSLSTCRFARTPPLPTYLLAVAVAPAWDAIAQDVVMPRASWASAAPSAAAVVRLRVLAPVASEQTASRVDRTGRWALDIAARALVWLAKHLDAPYLLDKLDLLSVPQFAAGAMEHPGLCTFRPSLLLQPDGGGGGSDDNSAAPIAEVVAHELAHQWVGNAVTVRAWRDIWLHEGLATYLSARCLAELEPTLCPWTAFVRQTRQAVMSYDDVHEAPSVCGMDRRFDRPVDIDDAFHPRTTYARGALVAALLRDVLRVTTDDDDDDDNQENNGDGPWRDVLRRYVRQHWLGNASTGAFLQAMPDEQARNVARTWLTRRGHPVVIVRLPPDGVGMATLTQFDSTGSSPPTLSATATAAEKEPPRHVAWPAPFSDQNSSGGGGAAIRPFPMRLVLRAGALPPAAVVAGGSSRRSGGGGDGDGDGDEDKDPRPHAAATPGSAPRRRDRTFSFDWINTTAGTLYAIGPKQWPVETVSAVLSSSPFPHRVLVLPARSPAERSAVPSPTPTRRQCQPTTPSTSSPIVLYTASQWRDAFEVDRAGLAARYGWFSTLDLLRAGHRRILAAAFPAVGDNHPPPRLWIDATVWRAALTQWSAMADLLSGVPHAAPCHAAWQQYIAAMIRRASSSTTPRHRNEPGESAVSGGDEWLNDREATTWLLLTCDDTKSLQNARQEWDSTLRAWTATSSSSWAVSPSNVVWKVAVRHDWPGAWDAAWRAYLQLRGDGTQAFGVLCLLASSRSAERRRQLLRRLLAAATASNTAAAAAPTVRGASDTENVVLCPARSSSAATGRPVASASSSCWHCGDDSNGTGLVRQDDAFACFRCFAHASPQACTQAWHFVQRHWADLVRRFGAPGRGPHTLYTSLSELVGQLPDEQDGDAAASWLRNHLCVAPPLPAALREQCAVGCQRRHYARHQLLPAVEEFLQRPDY